MLSTVRQQNEINFHLAEEATNFMNVKVLPSLFFLLIVFVLLLPAT